MREPAFWWRAPGLAAALLQPVAWGYGAIAGARMRRDGASAGIPVICIGNLTLGGTGKTPAAIAVATLLLQRGEIPCFLSRGYGGRLPGPLRVDPAQHRAADVGDEPLLLARTAPAVVARDRVAGAALARAQGASVIVMDDGLQNPALRKDLRFAVIDAARGIGNACVFPAGPLRAPLAAQRAHIDAMLTVGTGAGLPAALDGLPRVSTQLVPDAAAVSALAGRKVLAFAGIGHPEKFFATLRAAGIAIGATRAFPDHHPYTQAQARDLLAQADREGLVPVTTEKDRVRLDGGPSAALAARTAVLPVKLVFAQADAVGRLLDAALRKGAGASSAP
ncbi:MAG: tetraacyldisaccharide 4'-kinase [Pseudorhodoplanes sp.]